MSTAFANAAGKHFTDENSRHLFRASLFKTITILLHEIGHVFVTYLSKGQELSPRQINAPIGSVPVEIGEKNSGEAGFTLEYLVFDGTVTFFHEASSKTPVDQACFKQLLWSKVMLLAYMLIYTLVRHGLPKEGEWCLLSNLAENN